MLQLIFSKAKGYRKKLARFVMNISSGILTREREREREQFEVIFTSKTADILN